MEIIPGADAETEIEMQITETEEENKVGRDENNAEFGVGFPTRTKPYSCYGCRLKFSSKGELNLHKGKHERPFQCRINSCRLAFQTTDKRNGHEASHKKEENKKIDSRNFDPEIENKEERPMESDEKKSISSEPKLKSQPKSKSKPKLNRMSGQKSIKSEVPYKNGNEPEIKSQNQQEETKVKLQEQIQVDPVTTTTPAPIALKATRKRKRSINTPVASLPPPTVSAERVTRVRKPKKWFTEMFGSKKGSSSNSNGSNSNSNSFGRNNDEDFEYFM